MPATTGWPGDRSLYVERRRLRQHPGDGPALALRLGMDALRAWAFYGGFDGFRLDLAATLGRRETGFDPTAPFLAAVEQDPVLSHRVMIAEPWDIGPGGYQLGAFPPRWGEWNDRYRDTVRRFWRGDSDMLATSPPVSPDRPTCFIDRPMSRSINFITAHDGFTLARSGFVHGEAQPGERREQPTTGPTITCPGTTAPRVRRPILRSMRPGRATRGRLLATLLLSRGTPMLSMGDELGRTQHGNNNAYAQDNAGSWVDWASADDGLIEFTAAVIALRRTLAPLFKGQSLQGRPVDGSLIADVTWLAADGQGIELEPRPRRHADRRVIR